MADTTQEQLLRLFQEAAGNQGRGGDPGGEAYSLTSAARGGGSSDTAPRGNPNPITPYTAPTGNTGITAESVATTVLESGLGLVPMILGVIGLFEGGEAAPDVFTKYAMPDSIQFEGDTGNGATETDGFDQMGMPRAGTDTPDGAATQTNALQGTTTSANGAPSRSNGQSGAPQAMAQQIAAQPGAPQVFSAGQIGGLQTTPQIATQPSDPQWFMDHSSEIAQAVRSAMLNLSSLNDVVSDL